MRCHFHSLPRRCSLIVLCLIAALSMIGCSGDNLQIVRAPFISPIVAPGSDGIFRMNVAVENFSDEPHDPVYLWIRAEYPYGTVADGPHPCSQYDDFVAVPALEPGESWGLSDYRIDHGNPECPCEKYKCPGHVWLSLVWAAVPGPSLDGPNTSLHVTWSADGDLANLVVTEEH